MYWPWKTVTKCDIFFLPTVFLDVVTQEIKLCTSKALILPGLHISLTLFPNLNGQVKSTGEFQMSKTSFVEGRWGFSFHPAIAVLAHVLLLWCCEIPSLIHVGLFGWNRKSPLINAIPEEPRCSIAMMPALAAHKPCAGPDWLSKVSQSIPPV